MTRMMKSEFVNEGVVVLKDLVVVVESAVTAEAIVCVAGLMAVGNVNPVEITTTKVSMAAKAAVAVEARSWTGVVWNRLEQVEAILRLHAAWHGTVVHREGG